MSKLWKLLFVVLLTVTVATSAAPPASAILVAGPCDECDASGFCYACCKCVGGTDRQCRNTCETNVETGTN